MPAELENDRADFLWNSQRQLLYYHTQMLWGLWHGREQIFLQNWNGPVRIFKGKRPPYLPPELMYPQFSPDDCYVEGDTREGKVRYSLADGTRQAVTVKAGLTSPDGRSWLGPDMLMDMKLGLIYRTKLSLRRPCFSPDSQILAAALGREIALFDARTLRMIRRFPIRCWRVNQITFDETGHRLAVFGDGSVSVYDLNPAPPDLTTDNRLLAECWTGYRLSGGGARPLTEAEYWQRRRRLAEMPAPEPGPYIPIAAGFFGIGLLGFAYLVAGRSPSQKKV